MKPFKVTKPYFRVSFFFISLFLTQPWGMLHSLLSSYVSWWVPLCADTQSSIVLWLYWGNRNGPGPDCLHWSIKWASGGQSSSLLRPLFTLTFIELINKALGSGAVFTSPLLLLVAFITVIQTKVTLGTQFWFYRTSLPTFGEKKNVPPDYFHWSNSICKMELNPIAHRNYNTFMCKLWK